MITHKQILTVDLIPVYTHLKLLNMLKTHYNINIDITA